MKLLNKVVAILIGFASLSCEKEETGQFTAEILLVSCGGTVIQFSDAQVGEDWKNYQDGETYQNVALAGGISGEEVSEGQVLLLDYKEVQFLEGLYCAIGGLPSTNVVVWNVSVVQ